MTSITEKLLARADRVAPPPKVLNALLDITSSPNHQRADVARIVAADVAISGAILKLANSPEYARRSGRKLASIDEALGLLGEAEVVKLALSMGADVMKKGATGYGLVEQQLWQKSLRTALAAAHIATRAGYANAAQCYCAGLFIDVGKIVMSAAVARMEAPESDTTFDAEERSRFGLDHGELGAAIVSRWKLPSDIVAAVRHHHRPSEAPEEHRSICFVAHLADGLAAMCGGAFGIDAMAYALDPKWPDHIAITQNQAMELMFIVTEEFDAVSQQLGGGA